MSKEYQEAIDRAKINLADVRERGKEALGSWDDLERELFTTEEIAAGNLRVELMM